MTDPNAPNADMRQYWSEVAGPNWVSEQARLDRMLAPVGREAIGRLGLRPGEAVIDVGCGCGDASLDLARAVGPTGRVLGLDVSEPMATWARRRALDAGLDERVEIRVADAQTAAIDPEFDALFSRFGVMFFDDPVAAFRNLHAALRPGGRLAFACWQAVDLNPWMTTAREVLGRYYDMPPVPEEGAPGGFSFADPDRVRLVLGEAGFSGVRLEDRSGPLILGDSPEAAADFFSRLPPPGQTLRPDVQPEMADAFRAFPTSAAGVEAPAAAWIVSAQA